LTVWCHFQLRYTKSSECSALFRGLDKPHYGQVFIVKLPSTSLGPFASFLLNHPAGTVHTIFQKRSCVRDETRTQQHFNDTMGKKSKKSTNRTAGPKHAAKGKGKSQSQSRSAPPLSADDNCAISVNSENGSPTATAIPPKSVDISPEIANTKSEEERLAAKRAAIVKIVAEKKAEEARLEADRHAEEERLAASAAKKAEEKLEAEKRAKEEAKVTAKKQADEERLAAEKKAEEERLAAEKKAPPKKSEKPAAETKKSTPPEAKARGVPSLDHPAEAEAEIKQKQDCSCVIL
jgi:hypothetical protein